MGNAENNFLNGRTGADDMRGGAGNDDYTVDNSGDRVMENTSEGTDTVNSSVDFSLGANVENLRLTGTAVSGSGTALSNIIIGNAVDNVLNGGAGTDEMRGGGGNDTYIVDDAGDQVIENAGEGTADTVVASISYSLEVDPDLEALTLTGLAVNATGNGANNLLIGNARNNFLDGGEGADQMRGGVGDDNYIVRQSGDQVIENTNEGTDTVQSAINFSLGSNIENLQLIATAVSGTGNELANVITGNASDNILNAGLFDGGGDADILRGGAGSDSYFVDDTVDQVIENAGEGTDLVYALASYALGANSEVEKLLLEAPAVSGTGNDGDNTIIGNSLDNVINGGAGSDHLSAGGGRDTFSSFSMPAATTPLLASTWTATSWRSERRSIAMPMTCSTTLSRSVTTWSSRTTFCAPSRCRTPCSQH